MRFSRRNVELIIKVECQRNAPEIDENLLENSWKRAFSRRNQRYSSYYKRAVNLCETGIKLRKKFLLKHVITTRETFRAFGRKTTRKAKVRFQSHNCILKSVQIQLRHFVLLNYPKRQIFTIKHLKYEQVFKEISFYTGQAYLSI